MPLSPQEAVNRVNEQVTVEMLVKAAKNCQPEPCRFQSLVSSPRSRLPLPMPGSAYSPFRRSTLITCW